MAWYFMLQGMIRMKSKEKLTFEHIKEAFLRKIPPCGIVACFITSRTKEDGTPENVFRYMDKEKFSKRLTLAKSINSIVDFIDTRNQLYTGILQKFVQPKGEYNCKWQFFIWIWKSNWFADWKAVIRAIWSPKLIMYEKKESIKKINDLRYDFYERVFTFEAEDFHSKTGSPVHWLDKLTTICLLVPLRGYVLPNKLQRICHNIAQVERTFFRHLTTNFDSMWWTFHLRACT